MLQGFFISFLASFFVALLVSLFLANLYAGVPFISLSGFSLLQPLVTRNSRVAERGGMAKEIETSFIFVIPDIVVSLSSYVDS